MININWQTSSVPGERIVFWAHSLAEPSNIAVCFIYTLVLYSVGSLVLEIGGQVKCGGAWWMNQPRRVGGTWYIVHYCHFHNTPVAQWDFDNTLSPSTDGSTGARHSLFLQPNPSRITKYAFCAIFATQNGCSSLVARRNHAQGRGCVAQRHLCDGDNKRGPGGCQHLL